MGNQKRQLSVSFLCYPFSLTRFGATEESLENTMVELEQLSTYNAELHQSCDYVLKNFDVRQTARSEEMEALKQAKAILSGAKFEEFLQK